MLKDVLITFFLFNQLKDLFITVHLLTNDIMNTATGLHQCIKPLVSKNSGRNSVEPEMH